MKMRVRSDVCKKPRLSKATLKVMKLNWDIELFLMFSFLSRVVECNFLKLGETLNSWISKKS